jgi:hypothetical protein
LGPGLTNAADKDVRGLVARKDPARHSRVAARWLLRFLDEHPAATIEEASLAASCLAALPGAGYAQAAQALKAMAETATRRRRESGVGWGAPSRASYASSSKSRVEKMVRNPSRS